MYCLIMHTQFVFIFLNNFNNSQYKLKDEENVLN